jgi:hypothetical protein
MGIGNYYPGDNELAMAALLYYLSIDPISQGHFPTPTEYPRRLYRLGRRFWNNGKIVNASIKKEGFRMKIENNENSLIVHITNICYDGFYVNIKLSIKDVESTIGNKIDSLEFEKMNIECRLPTMEVVDDKYYSMCNCYKTKDRRKESYNFLGGQYGDDIIQGAIFLSEGRAYLTTEIQEVDGFFQIRVNDALRFAFFLNIFITIKKN